MTSSIVNTVKNKRAGLTSPVRLVKGAYIRRLFHVLPLTIINPVPGTLWARLLIAASMVLLPWMPIQAGCAPKQIDLHSQVSRVIDGDTLQLKDSTRVRLIGINTPEIKHSGTQTEHLANDAKIAVQQLLASADYRVKLQYDRERYDRYGRTLAHVFLEDGRNIAEHLLLSGLGVHVAFPPNLWAINCYIKSETQARQHNKALWRSNVTNAKQISRNTRGFHFVQGKVTDIGYSKKSVWINVGPYLGVRIARRELGQFKSIDFKKLRHKTVLVRGWITPQKNKSIIRLRHSSMIEIMK